MLDLGVIIEQKHEIKLPTGETLIAKIPQEKLYIKIVNDTQEYYKYIAAKDATLEKSIIIINQILWDIYNQDNADDLVNKLLELNVRIKNIVLEDYFKFISTIDKSPN